MKTKSILVACAWISILTLPSYSMAALSLTTESEIATAQQGGETVYIFSPNASVRLSAEYHDAIFELDDVTISANGSTFFDEDRLFYLFPSTTKLLDLWEDPATGITEMELNAKVNFSSSSESATLLVCRTVAGDTDLDGDVDFTDFLVLSANFGMSGGWTEGDFNQNGTVDFDDFLAQSANFGFGT